MNGELDLALGVLDHQLLDADGRRCGNVDDLELERLANGELRVAAILSGPGAWRGRGWMGSLASRPAKLALVRVPWEEVESVDAAVRLRRRADELGLGRGDDRARRWVSRLPGAAR
jgi:hypothetical protein